MLEILDFNCGGFLHFLLASYRLELLILLASSIYTLGKMILSFLKMSGTPIFFAFLSSSGPFFTLELLSLPLKREYLRTWWLSLGLTSEELSSRMVLS